MELFYYRAPGGNFGDDLNAWLWPRLIPNLHRLALADWLVGIGTILDERLLQLPGRKLILGAGHRPSNRWIARIPSDWVVSWVRGPLTAKALDLPNSTAVADPGLLVSALWRPERRGDTKVGFMPHVFTTRYIDCERACHRARLRYIDPQAPVETVLATLDSCDRVIVEAMHGAIVADALEIPWSRIRVLSWRRESIAVSEFKWNDWLQSHGINAPQARAANPIVWLGRGARILNPILMEAAVRQLTTALIDARDNSEFLTSTPDVRRRLLSQLLERVHEISPNATTDASLTM